MRFLGELQMEDDWARSCALIYGQFGTQKSNVRRPPGAIKVPPKFRLSSEKPCNWRVQSPFCITIYGRPPYENPPPIFLDYRQRYARALSANYPLLACFLHHDALESSTG